MIRASSRGKAASRRQQALLDALEESAKIYDPSVERNWEQKYKFFSAGHMKGSYRVYARARHDPFNKDPSWGKGVIARVAEAYSKKGIDDPMDLFRGVSVKNGNLNRPELMRVLCSVLPDLSDLEATAIFDAIDSDRSGEINITEFCETLRRGRSVAPETKTAADRWRNPVHRIGRLPPARAEGWDHLEGPCGARRFDDLCDREQSEIMSRLGGQLVTKGNTKLPDSLPKYKYFNGGADSRRFERHAWSRSPLADARYDGPFPDPGPERRPGWLCDPAGQAALRRLGTPRRRPAATAAAAES